VNTPRIRTLIALALVVLTPVAALSASIHADETATPTDRIIIKWRNASRQSLIGDERVQGLAQRVSRRLTSGRVIGGGMSVVRFDRERSGTDLESALKALRSDPDVELAVVDKRVHIQATPNDPLFASGQWYLKSTQPAAIRADAAWDVAKGGASPSTSVIVAVIDTGVRFDHPDLAGKLVPGYDFISSAAVSNDGDGWDADASDTGDFLTAQELASDTFKGKGCGAGTNKDQPTASSWHGTRVAGMIAAATDNATGIAGTGYNLRVQPLRALGKCGGFNSDVIAAMYWAAGMSPPAAVLGGGTVPPLNPTPAQVINMSLGSDDPCDAMYTQATTDITAHGVLIVASAGNEGISVGDPANCPGVMAVVGVRHVGTKVGFSSLGSLATIAAPAGNCVNTGTNQPCLFSLDTTTNDGQTTPGNNTYTNQTNSNVGTSFSSPQAAAVAGLMKSVNPALTPAAIIARIKSSARAFPTTSDTTPAPPVCHQPTSSTDVQDTECICTTQVCGAGLLFASGAVNEALRPIALAALTGTVGPGAALTLDGSRSGVATGRTASYQWTVLSTSTATATIQNPTLAVATVTAPSQGTVNLRLTVTDNLGASDTANLTFTVASTGGSSSSTAPPPSTAMSSGGGGAVGWPLLLGLAILFGLRARRLAAA
jgi:serine protease